MSPSPLSLTNMIVLLTCVISFALMNNHEWKSRLVFHPVTIRQRQQWYRFISSGFIHGDFTHLLVNMFVFWSFGNAVERLYYPHFLGDHSPAMFLLLYFGGIVAGSVPSYIRNINNPRYAALGASGGVSAVVFAIILFAPWENLYLYAVIPIPQILAAGAYLYYSWYMDRQASDNIGHMAHFTGAIWGFVFTGLMNPSLFPRFVAETLKGPAWL